MLSTILPCQVYEALHCCMLRNGIWDSSALLRARCILAVFHSSETHYDVGWRETRQKAMSAHISGYWDNHFEQASDIDNTCWGGF